MKNLRPSLANRATLIFPAALLVAATFLIYWQTLHQQFLVLWDDPSYVIRNPAVKGITFSNLKASFTNFYVGNYAPIQILSYMVDYSFWGLNPAGFKFSNIFIHAANGVIFYFLLLRMSSRKSVAFIAALIFLVHPIQVESVAWISQRKNVLSMFFFLIAFYMYICYRDKHNNSRWFYYICSVTVFVLSLLTKSVTVVLPIVLLAFDLWRFPSLTWKSKLFDKIPYVTVSVIFGVVTLKSQSQLAGGISSFPGGTPLTTFYTMIPIFIRYLAMTIWPTKLSAVYVPPIKTSFDVEVALSTVLLLFIFVMAAFLYFRKRVLFFWIAFYFICLLPVSQIVPLVTLMNDRYLYFPLLGAAAFLSFLTYELYVLLKKRKRRFLVTVAPLMAVLLCFYTISTIKRVPVWRDEKALWEDAINKYPNSPIAHFQYANLLNYYLGNVQEAIRQYKIGLTLLPLQSQRFFLAELYQKSGYPDKAIEQYLIILKELPTFTQARDNLALIYIDQGMFDEAIDQYNIALQYNPNWAKGHNNIAAAYFNKGNLGAAIEHFKSAVSLQPANPQLHFHLGTAYLKRGWREKARQEFMTAVSLDASNQVFQNKLAELEKTK